MLTWTAIGVTEYVAVPPGCMAPLRRRSPSALGRFIPAISSRGRSGFRGRVERWRRRVEHGVEEQGRGVDDDALGGQLAAGTCAVLDEAGER